MKDQDKNDSKNNKKKESKEKKPSNSNWKSFLDQGQEKKR